MMRDDTKGQRVMSVLHQEAKVAYYYTLPGLLAVFYCLVLMQGKLLHAAAMLVKPHGLLVYSTCSIDPQENQQQADCFLASHLGFATEDAPAAIPAGVVMSSGAMAVWPPNHFTDGAFAVRLRNKGQVTN